MPETYVNGTTNDFEKVSLGKDEYFVMGDNRENSLDSRDYRVGLIKKEDIVIRKLIDNMIDLLISLSKDYPKNIKVKEMV